MKKIKAILLSLCVGMVLSVAPIAIYAACAPTIVHEGQTCTLSGSNCDGSGVCVCSYTCGPIGPEQPGNN